MPSSSAFVQGDWYRVHSNAGTHTFRYIGQELVLLCGTSTGTVSGSYAYFIGDKMGYTRYTSQRWSQSIIEDDPFEIEHWVPDA